MLSNTNKLNKIELCVFVPNNYFRFKIYEH